MKIGINIVLKTKDQMSLQEDKFGQGQRNHFNDIEITPNFLNYLVNKAEF